MVRWVQLTRMICSVPCGPTRFTYKNVAISTTKRMNAQLGTRIKKAFGIELDALKLTQVNFEKIC